MPSQQSLLPTPALPVPRQRLIYWPAVLGAAVLSLVVVGLMTVTVWASSRRPMARHETTPVVSVAPRAADEPVPRPPAQVVELPEPPKPAPAPDRDVAPTVPTPPAQVVELPEPLKLAPEPDVDVAPTAPSTQTYGTAVSFFHHPAEAARQAVRENKLLFVLHLSGNLEDDCFT